MRHCSVKAGKQGGWEAGKPMLLEPKLAGFRKNY